VFDKSFQLNCIPNDRLHDRNDSASARAYSIFDNVSVREEGFGSIDNLLDIKSILALGRSTTTRTLSQAFDD